jgi:hypothetical protein
MYTRYHKDGTLPQNGEVFVFGSNLAGIHGAGAARVALDKYGALWGKGVGLHGMTYAIPTKDEFIHTLPLYEVEEFVKQFVSDSNFYEDSQYFVTRVGCGLAGFKDEQIAPMFKGAKNCSFAEEWRQYIEE